MPDWFPVALVNSWLEAWAREIVFSLLIGALAGWASLMFGEGGKGD